MMIKRLSKLLVAVVLTPFFRVDISGRENIPDSGSAILCSNHVTMLDMFFIGYRMKRWVYWMAKEELFRIPVVSFVLGKLWEAFPVKRGRADIQSIKTALEHLEKGRIVGIFPQGTREGKNIRNGAAVLATKANVHLIPAFIEGGNKIFGRVRVVFGKPFKLDIGDGIETDRKVIRGYSKIIMDRINELLEDTK